MFTQALLFPDQKPLPKRHKYALDDSDQALLLQWCDLLRGKARRKSRRMQEADQNDAEQEAILAAALSIGTYRVDRSQPQTHIGFAADCRLKTFVKRAASRGFAGLGGVNDVRPLVPGTSTIGETDYEDRREPPIGATVDQLRAAMKELSNDEYIVIFYRRIVEMTGAEVASMLDTTVDEIDRIEAAAMDRLGRMLAE